MPSKKKKYNTRFPAGRIKKIMQSDEEVGKVAQAVPIIISRTVELFIESLLEKTFRITKSRNAKTLSPSHMKTCIMSESRFDFLRELVKDIPDISVAEEAEGELASPPTPQEQTQQPYDFSLPSTSCSVIVQPTTNGNSTRNGTQISNSLNSPSYTPPSSSSASSTLSSSAISYTPKAENRFDLKRSWDSPTDFSSNCTIRANFYKENTVIQHTSDATDPVPPKLLRTDSAPPNVYSPIEASTISKKPQRRLQHQPKSIPCTSKDKFQPPSVPPSIINIDVCNTPIVKIDYSNLTIPDTETSDAALSIKKDSTTNITNSPIINIDLSKIATQFSTNPVPAPPSQLQINNNSLDLDEDYDNI